MKYHVLRFLPRVLSIAFILFLSMFALDVFGAYQGWELIVALLAHLIPSFVLLAFTIVAWRYELVGAVGFIALSALYICIVGPGRPWS